MLAKLVVLLIEASKANFSKETCMRYLLVGSGVVTPRLGVLWCILHRKDIVDLHFKPNGRREDEKVPRQAVV